MRNYNFAHSLNFCVFHFFISLVQFFHPFFCLLISPLLSPPPLSSPLPFSLSLSYLLLLLLNLYRSLVSLCVVSRLSQGHTSFVGSVAFGPGDLLASGSYDNTIKLWDMKTGKNVNTLTVCRLFHSHAQFFINPTNLLSK